MIFTQLFIIFVTSRIPSIYSRICARYENILVKAIVEDIIKKLNGVSTIHIDSENFVGTEQPVEEIESLLQLDLLNVRVIGLWGRGGIGKTTLASLVFCKLDGKFDAYCFVDNVREKWEKRERYHLGKEIFLALLGEKDTTTSSKFEMSHFQKDRLKRTKSLIVLDDVNDRGLLEYLVGYRECLCDGSRIIVTSRDSQCFPSDFVDAIYEVEGLNPDKAYQLFCKNALKRSSNVPYPAELTKRVVEYAKGIPLILNHLRSLFKPNRSENCNTLLDELKTSPAGEKIQDVLMLSYNDLTRRQKSVFLHIVCGFKDCKRQIVERILDDPDFCVVSTIDDLVDKSLISINHCGELCMHDLIQEMGLKVIKEESLQPEWRTRLCDARDIWRALKNNKVSRKQIAHYI